MEFRAATLDDAPQLGRILHGLWHTQYLDFLPQSAIDYMTETRAIELIDAALHNPQRQSLVVHTEQILGFTLFEQKGEEGWIHSLYVSEAAQGMGCGRQLIKRACQSMIGQGATRCCLWVFADNLKSQGFYQHCGWQPDGVRRVELEFGVLEFRMSRELP